MKAHRTQVPQQKQKTQQINLPEGYTRTPPQPDDPKGSLVLAKKFANSSALLIIHPIHKSEALPFDDRKSVIDSLHQIMGEKQGLIKVGKGKTKADCRYVYTIVKTESFGKGTQYNLTMQIERDTHVVNIAGYFEEEGELGYRRKTVLDRLMKNGVVDENLEGWQHDPYDLNYKKGRLMNMSELEQYDKYFDQFALSELRKLRQFMVENN